MPSVRKSYDEELLQLDTLLARMGHEAGAAIESALTALRNDDIELARSVVARDSQIDASEHEIEHRCLQLLLRQQPVASDLRKVSTALKMVTDVERIGDQASDIAELVLHLHAKSTDAVGVLEDILKMGDDVLKMVKRSIAAYVQVDLAAAAEVIAHDDVIDAAFRRISSEIAQYIAAHPTEAETALDLFMVTKYLETVVLLSKGEIDSKKVRVEFSLEDMDMSGFQKGATYEQIKAYVLEHTGLKVSSLYISQIKRKCGLDVGQNYNLSKKEDAKVPKCPPEKEAAIRDALKYFQMI